MSLDPVTVATILAMALATCATRVSGFAILRGLRPTGRIRMALDAMPGAILLSIVAPGFAEGGPAEWVAALVTVALALKAPTIVAVVAGVGTVVALRALLGS